MAASCPQPRDASAAVRPGALALRVAAFGAGYFLLCRVGDELHASTSDFAVFWPASGAFLAVVLLSAPARWGWLAAAVVGAELAAGLVFDRPAALALAYGGADAVEAVAGAVLIRRFWSPAQGLRRVRHLIGVMALGGLAAGLGSLVGTLSYHLVGSGRGSFASMWLQWWACDALGVFLVAPALLAWATGARPVTGSGWRRVPEALALAAATLGTSLLTFGPGGVVHLEHGYLLVPALGWAAFRFGLRGASALGAALAFLSAWSLSRAPEVGAALAVDATLQVQLLLAVCVPAALILAAALQEREAAEADRRGSEALFDAFLANSPAALFILDGAGRLVRASRAFERMMGRPTPDLLGQTAE